MRRKLLLGLVLVCLFTVPCLAGKMKWQYTDPAGWRIFFMKPVGEFVRFQKFEAKWECCGPIMQDIVDSGGFKLYNEIRFSSDEDWWVFGLDILDGQFLIFDKRSKFTMVGVTKQDTVLIDSERISFCIGWGDVYRPSLTQHTILNNTERSIQVRKTCTKGTNDFEWINADNGKEKCAHVVLGYVCFGEHQEVKKVVDFLPSGITSSQKVGITSSRR